MYWNAPSGQRKMRFLVPVVTWAPGASSPTSPPADFVHYLRGQAKNGIHLSHEAGITVDGHPATLLTVTSDPTKPDGFYDGSAGCISRNEDQGSEDGCFGFQPDLAIRLAVVPLGGKTLLAWARPDDGAPSAGTAFTRGFESMLHSIHFR